MQHGVRCSTVLHATLCYMQHCVTCNTVLQATLCYMQNCVTCNTVLHATLCYMQNCVTCNTVLHATLCYMQHCVTCNTVLHATLCYMQNCVCILIDSARHIENSFDPRLSSTLHPCVELAGASINRGSSALNVGVVHGKKLPHSPQCRQPQCEYSITIIEHDSCLLNNVLYCPFLN